jgi:hypothetical protein
VAAAAAPGPVKVLYVAGAGRSGSTLLDAILGQLDGFFSAGELRYLWERGLVEGRLCGCGTPVASCSTWRSVLAEAWNGDRAEGGGGPPTVSVTDARALAAWQRRATRVRRAPAMIASSLLGSRPGGPARAGKAHALLGRLYRAAGRQSGCRVLVDSSKLPSYGWLLGRLPEVDLYVVHLVRDPRATAWSWLRRKRLTDTDDDARMMQRQPPLKSAIMWTVWNLVAALLWSRSDRYLRLRYEDLVASPEDAVRRIAALLGELPGPMPFPAPGTVALAPTHSVAGNPARLVTGEVPLRLDDEWAHRLRPGHELLVTLTTLPLLLRYRYRLAPLPDKTATEREGRCR